MVRIQFIKNVGSLYFSASSIIRSDSFMKIIINIYNGIKIKVSEPIVMFVFVYILISYL